MRLLFAALIMLLAASMTMAKTTLKISTLYPPGTEAVTSLQALGKQLSEQTQGQVTLKVYPGGVMGDDSTVMRKIRIGQLQGALVSGSALELLSEDLSGLSNPFQFSSLAEVYKQRQTKDAQFRASLAKAGWASFGPLDGGFAYLMSSHPIGGLNDLRAAKLWLPNTPDIQRMAKKMSVDYLVMGIGDVLTALDTGAVDTLASPPSAALALNWYSRFKYFTETPVVYTFGMLVLPEKVLNKIPAAYQEQVRTALTDWATKLDLEMRKSNANAFVALQKLLKPYPFNAQDIDAIRQAKD